MRKLMAVALAIMALALAGVANADEDRKTKAGWPACPAEEGPEIFMDFMQAVASQDKFLVHFYTAQKGCGPMKGDMRAEILERLPILIKIRIHPEGFPSAEVFTVPESLQ
jgi:hypothetical protein